MAARIVVRNEHPVGRVGILMACFLAYIAAGFAAATLGPSLPSLAGMVGLPLAGAGMLRAARQGGTLIAQLPSGWLLDRLGARVVLLAGAVLIGVGSVLTVVAPGLG